MIELTDVSKHYGSLQVLTDVSMRFGDGEVTAILGPSGAGKSTLIRCINCLETISGGDIKVDGRSVRDKRAVVEIQKQTSMVFQHFNLYPHLNALQNITLAPIQVLKLSRPEAEARAADPIARKSPKPGTAGAAIGSSSPAPFASNAPSPARTTNDIGDRQRFPFAVKPPVASINGGHKTVRA